MFRLIATLFCITAAAAITVTPRASNFTLVPGLHGAVVSCGSSGSMHGIRVSGCKSIPCRFKIGETVLIQADFTPSFNHTTLEMHVSAERNGVELPKRIESVSGLRPHTLYTVQMPLEIEESLKDMLTIKISAVGEDVKETCGWLLASVEK